MQLKIRKSCKILSAFLGSFIILIIILAYSQYLELKRSLIAQISGRATALIGQKVELGDIYLDSSGSITVADIVIKSPEGFFGKDLLRIRKLRLDLRYRELFSGRFSLRSIELVSPELSLITEHGKLNISDTFRKFFSKNGTAEYLIDELSIKNARFSVGDETLYSVGDMNLSMNNIASDKGTKTSLKASLAFLGSNKMLVEGWVYLNNAAKTFSLAARAEDINLSLLSGSLAKFGIALDKSRAGLLFQAEGDTEQGIKLKTGAQLKSAGMSIFRKRAINHFSVAVEAFLDINKNAMIIRELIAKAGDESSIQAKGTIKGISGTPSYSAEFQINRFDLASLDIMKDLKISGILSSGPVLIKGILSSAVPEAAGTIMISNGALNMNKAAIQNLNAKIAFASGKDLSVSAGVSASILRAGDVLFRQPVQINTAAEAKGTPGDIRLKAEFDLSGIYMELKGKEAGADHINAAYDGTIQDKTVSGRASLEVRELFYDRYKAKNFLTEFALDYDKNKILAKKIKAVSDLFSAEGDMIAAILPEVRGGLVIKAENLSGSYPDKKAEFKGLDCTAAVTGLDSGFSGDLSFKASQALFQGISLGPIIGKGSIADGEFILDLPSVKLFDGSLSMFAKGRSTDSPFPIALNLTAENINLTTVSHAAKSFFKTPYTASGSAEHISFEGTISSFDNIKGRASVRGRNISITGVEGKALFKDAAVNSDIVLRGRDMDFKAEASASGLALTLSGTAENFLEKGRALSVSLLMPETLLSDIRTAFWDIVPDSYLYAGLDGSIAVNLLATYGSGGSISANGGVLLRDIALEGENSEYAIGPVNGTLPIHYHSEGEGSSITTLSSFERSDFEELKKTFAETKNLAGSELRIGAVRYGFRLLEDISAWVEQKGRSLKINRISAKMFGGRVNGSVFVDLIDVPSYRAGMIADGISLAQLCEEIPPIKGYISGRIDGIATIKGSGAGLANILGKADFWTYSAEGEKTRISREFLEKIGGPQLRAYIGERRFSKGIMGLYIQNGFIVFRDLEISNRNFLGITDLSLKVAPLNNRIAIDHLMWTITEAAQRAKKE